MEDLTLKHQQVLKASGISILLLPSELLENSVKIIIPRQLARGFSLNEYSEREKFTRRFPIYKELGDIKIFSSDKPEIIAEQMKNAIEKYNVPNPSVGNFEAKLKETTKLAIIPKL